MRTVGIIAEFNPFHNGHKHIIDTVKSNGNRVVCVIGDDFTQRGDVAIISKYARAEAALKCGVDLCLLLPTPWSMSCAYNFALGGISVLNSLGNVDTIAFGSECGDIEKISRVTSAVHSDEITPLLHSELKSGVTFAKARQDALLKLIGQDADILSNPNDTLATEYVFAAQSLGFSPDFLAVKRVGCAHDSLLQKDIFLSASAIREHIKQKKYTEFSSFMPNESYDILMREINQGSYASLENLELAILAHLRRTNPCDFKCVPEVGEGLENRIISAALESTTLYECFDRIKSKRYTLARIRRIVLSAFLGLDMTFFGQPVPYIKVLGFNAIGEKILKEATPTVPLITRGKDYTALDGKAEECFNVQNTAANLYSLSQTKRGVGGGELTTAILKNR